MVYASIDSLQKALASSVFSYAKDSKKASGRALGTLIEVITYYLLKTWKLENHIAIERPLPEYQNPDITHNVEYSLHPFDSLPDLDFKESDLPITARKVFKSLKKVTTVDTLGNLKTSQLLSRAKILRNSCVLGDVSQGFLLATLASLSGKDIKVSVRRFYNAPFAIFECKRVGIEEGVRKGPQTIEKAKQGAYVAKSVSALQKIRLSNGKLEGILHKSDGTLLHKPYGTFVQQIINSSDRELLNQFILTVGVVSNHGNWFTSANLNKELKVLAQSYDWLLFLTDKGLSQFIQKLILKPSKQYLPVRKAFLNSYKGKSGSNQFTKVKMNLEADSLLKEFFRRNVISIHKWFNVISPTGKKLSKLQKELRILTRKNWKDIRS